MSTSTDSTDTPTDAPARRGTGKTRRFVDKTAWQVGIVAVALVAWEFLPPALDISPLVFPRLRDVLGQFGEPVTGSGTLLANALTTIRLTLSAFAIAAVAGVTVGVVIGVLPAVRHVALPLLNAAFAIPWITLIPLFLVTLGLGGSSKIAFGALYAFFPIVFNTVAGVSRVEREYLLVGQAFGLPAWQRLGKIILPASARPIMGGLQIGMAIAVIAVVSTEMFGSVAGMGYLIQRSSQGLHVAEVYYLVLVTLLVAFLMLYLITLLGRMVGVRLEASAG